MKFDAASVEFGPVSAAHATLLGDVLRPCGLLALPARLRLAESLAAPGQPLALVQSDLAALPLPLEPARRAETLGLVVGALPSCVVTTSLADQALGHVVPILSTLPGRLELGELPPRLARALESRRVTTWRALAGQRPDEIARWPRIGAAAVSELFRLAVSAAVNAVIDSKAGPAAADRAKVRPSDLATLFEHERRFDSRGLQRALQGFLVPDTPIAVQAAARRLLALGPAPPPAAVVSMNPTLNALTRLSERLGDTRDRVVFEQLCLFEATRPAEVARALEIGCERIRQLRQRVEGRAKDLAEATPDLAAPVAQLRRELAIAAPVVALDTVLTGLGLPGPSDVRSALLIWLAGPYRSVTEPAGWISTDGDGFRATTRRLLAEDGGVHRTALVRKELARAGMVEAHADAWLVQQPVRVHDDATVFLVGSPATVAERILSATGEAMSAQDCRRWAGDELLREPAWRDAMRRDPRFVHVGDNRFELAEWGGEPSAFEPARAPIVALNDAEASHEPDDPGRATLRIVVDDPLLAGAPGTVPASLVARLGIAVGATHSVSTRYGPLALTNTVDGSRRGSLRPIALASGATAGDVLMLRFDPASAAASVELLVGLDTVPTP